MEVETFKIVNDKISASYQANSVFQELYQTLQTKKINFENWLTFQKRQLQSVSIFL